MELRSYADHFLHHQSRPMHKVHIHSSSSTKWSPEENKLFENALAVYDKDSPDKWEKVAAMIPGKGVLDVMKQYQELEADVLCIEAGLVPLHPPAAFTVDYRVTGVRQMSSSYGQQYGFSELVNNDGSGGSSSSSRRRRLASLKTGSEQDRKKGVPWTEQEHKLFLLGLNKYGKGDWRNISRNFVISRTPTQVASHAQKYFLRQLSGSRGKEKRRTSIHDITILNLTQNQTRSPPDHLSFGQKDSSGMFFQWNKSDNNSGGNSMDFINAYGSNSNRAGQGSQSGRSGMLDSYTGSQSFGMFQIQTDIHERQV